VVDRSGGWSIEWSIDHPGAVVAGASGVSTGSTGCGSAVAGGLGARGAVTGVLVTGVLVTGGAGVAVEGGAFAWCSAGLAERAASPAWRTWTA
jgi:hypothetical protein